MPVSIGDSVKIAINLFNLKGLVNLKSIQWENPIFEEIPQIPKQINEKNIESIPGDRICELETLLSEWVPFQYHLNRSCDEIDIFKPYLLLKDSKCCGVGMLAIKSQYILSQTGI